LPRRSFGALGLLALGLACSGSSTRGETDLGSGTDCVVLPVCQVEGVAETGTCVETADCPAGMICDDPDLTSRITTGCGGSVCLNACECWGDDVCNDAGQCRPPRCDEPDAPPCPAHFRCDPDAVPDDIAEIADGSSVADNTKLEHLHVAGCVRKRCDEPDGFVCRALYRCELSEDTQKRRCTPIPCAESGQCLSEQYTCAPGIHPRFGMDQFGCALKNCDDPDYVCTSPGEALESGGFARIERRCDFESPLADPFGCAPIPCDTPGYGCLDGLVCDPTSTEPVASNGCRMPHCPAEACPSGRHCDPEHGGADVSGCVSDVVIPGGSGGVGGSGGASGSGGAAKGGGTGGPAASGGSGGPTNVCDE
jgi:hypothetical protein